MNKRAIVSLANNKGNYVQALSRLSKSLLDDHNADFFGFIGEGSVGAPLHSDNPYAFKVYAIEHVRNLGYNQILWVDSSLYAIKDTAPIWEAIDKDGYFLHEAGHYVGTWCNDFTLNYFNLSREDAMKITMYTGGFFGLDFTHDFSRTFFAVYKDAMANGCFIGDWSNHRHDMTCGSVIANQLGMKYQNGGEWLDYSGPYKVPKNDTIIFYAQGI